MSKDILIILGSARKKSDTEAYIKFVFDNTPYRIIDLLDFEIAHYSYQERYPATDDFLKLINQMLEYKVIVFSTPFYWYAMSGIMKTFFDRFSDLINTQKTIGRKLAGKVFSLLSVGSDPEMSIGFEVPFQSTAEYFNCKYIGSTYFSTKIQIITEQKADKNTFINKLSAHI